MLLCGAQAGKARVAVLELCPSGYHSNMSSHWGVSPSILKEHRRGGTPICPHFTMTVCINKAAIVWIWEEKNQGSVSRERVSSCDGEKWPCQRRKCSYHAGPSPASSGLQSLHHFSLNSPPLCGCDFKQV